MSNLNATEYWIETSKNGKLPDLVFDKQQPSTKNSLIVHVIEYPAYQALLEQAERMAEALKYYSNRKNWSGVSHNPSFRNNCAADAGLKASEALKQWQEFNK